MKISFSAVGIVFRANAAQAQIPFFNATLRSFTVSFGINPDQSLSVI